MSAWGGPSVTQRMMLAALSSFELRGAMMLAAMCVMAMMAGSNVRDGADAGSNVLDGDDARLAKPDSVSPATRAVVSVCIHDTSAFLRLLPQCVPCCGASSRRFL